MMVSEAVRKYEKVVSEAVRKYEKVLLKLYGDIKIQFNSSHGSKPKKL